MGAGWIHNLSNCFVVFTEYGTILIQKIKLGVVQMKLSIKLIAILLSSVLAISIPVSVSIFVTQQQLDTTRQNHEAIIEDETIPDSEPDPEPDPEPESNISLNETINLAYNNVIKGYKSSFGNVFEELNLVEKTAAIQTKQGLTNTEEQIRRQNLNDYFNSNTNEIIFSSVISFVYLQPAMQNEWEYDTRYYIYVPEDQSSSANIIFEATLEDDVVHILMLPILEFRDDTYMEYEIRLEDDNNVNFKFTLSSVSESSSDPSLYDKSLTYYWYNSASNTAYTFNFRESNVDKSSTTIFDFIDKINNGSLTQEDINNTTLTCVTQFADQNNIVISSNASYVLNNYIQTDDNILVNRDTALPDDIPEEITPDATMAESDMQDIYYGLCLYPIELKYGRIIFTEYIEELDDSVQYSVYYNYTKDENCLLYGPNLVTLYNNAKKIISEYKEWFESQDSENPDPTPEQFNVINLAASVSSEYLAHIISNIDTLLQRFEENNCIFFTELSSSLAQIISLVPIEELDMEADEVQAGFCLVNYNIDNAGNVSRKIFIFDISGMFNPANGIGIILKFDENYNVLSIADNDN